MPLLAQAIQLVRSNLEEVSRNVRVSLVTIGHLHPAQFADLNRYRSGHGLHELESNEIVFLGKHIHGSRIVKDGYSIDDVLAQIAAAIANTSTVHVGPRMSALHSTVVRADGYGNTVLDQAIFEMTARKPRAELFSVIPKGDAMKPSRLQPTAQNAKSPPEGELPTEDAPG